MIFYSWRCLDNRYLVRKKGSANTQAETISSTCTWYKEYSLLPSDLECVLTYCANATLLPNVDGHNYDFNPSDTWWYATNQSRAPLGWSLWYPCKNGHRVENNTLNKEGASTGFNIKCGPDGLFLYPDPWPQCSQTVECPDPGNGTDLTRNVTTGTLNSYSTVIRYALIQ